jgi:hypothetical protein
MKNPFRALNPAGYDKGANINRRAGDLQKLAAKDLSEAEASTALGNALGNIVAAMVVKRPNLSMNEILDTVFEGVRERAHIAAGLPYGTDEARELTEEEFNALASRINRIAATKTLPSDAMTATAKALGTLIGFTARRDECSMEDLVQANQAAIAEYALRAFDAA